MLFTNKTMQLHIPVQLQKEWLQGEAKKHGFSIMELRANSGDLNPIEHLWSYI